MLMIAVCQLPLDVEKPVTFNIGLAEGAILRACAIGAKLIVLPELANSGYVFKDREEAISRATTLDGSVIRGWIEIAAREKITLVAGLNLLVDGNLRNASVIIDQSGLRGHYFKAHLWNNELDIFVPGDEPPLVIDTEFGRLATMVCYDLEFTEWVRLAMLDDAVVMALPTNWPSSGLPAIPTALEAVRVQAAASQNKMVVAAADRCRSERGVIWSSASVIADSDGVLRATADPAGGAEIQVLVADVEIPTDRKLSTRNDARTDRRVHLYGDSLRP